MKKTPEFFDTWARKNNMVPVVRKRDEKHADILLADSGIPFWGETEEGIGVKFYRTGFAIYRDECWIGSIHDYFESDFFGIPPNTARDMRIEEALGYARKYLKETVNAGLYDDARKNSFSKRPD